MPRSTLHRRFTFAKATKAEALDPRVTGAFEVRMKVPRT